jgi:uncharacterized membrane protein YdbT with pleckstrin-like domain
MASIQCRNLYDTDSAFHKFLLPIVDMAFVCRLLPFVEYWYLYIVFPRVFVGQILWREQ